MKAKLVRFGEIEVDGRGFRFDVVIEGGKVRKRKKGPSKTYRAQLGHTPLSADEAIPWGGDRLIVGTGLYGSLPVMPEVFDEGERRGVEVVTRPTEEACRLLAGLKARDVNAILHVTC